LAPEERDPDSRPLSAIVVGGTHSGVGKTTITLGLIGAFRRRGLVVQPFKVGPDFIDPLHHAHASGRPPRNLDGWMLEADVNRRRFDSATADADVALIEGVMGLYDGAEGKTDRGSTAEMAKLLDLPVLLVVDAGAMARSAAAVVHGFVTYDPAVRIVGVILNNVGGASHADMIREAVGDGVPILGALPHVEEMGIPERHLGLHLPYEARDDYIEQAATLIERHVDIGQLLKSSVTARRPAPAPVARTKPCVRIGIARDQAFCFYYSDNLELLAQAGAELVEFSPIRDPLPPNLDGLYVGGGYPELHGEALAQNTGTTTAIREFAQSGGPVYAECGGLMYLADQLRVGDHAYPLCGILPFSTTMPAPLKIGYVEVETTGGLFGTGHKAKGHLFHRSEIDGDPSGSRCYRVRNTRGELGEEGYERGNVLASYVHLHFASDPSLAIALVKRCEAFRARATPKAC
jgi:cobyrinic acid a,c-diamide synthase